uniref:Serine/threonine kinase 33 n=1 Tax=Lates calcarifer TaxID=8187 RepID=A0A4W6DMP6_LATCA
MDSPIISWLDEEFQRDNDCPLPPSLDDSTDVSGLDMDMVSPRTSRDTSEKHVPVIRLEEDEIYKFGRKLGQGSFGVVYEATHIETQTNWAIKEVCRPAAGSSKVKMLAHEIEILKQMNHAHIIHLQEVYETPRMIYLVTELCAGGELTQLLKRKKFFTEDETRHIICSLADAVAYLHKRDIMHRDLKLENILVKNSPDEDDNDRINIKVTDFGLAVQTSGVGIENIMTEACGTLIYMAPEMMTGCGYTQWCDMWSIGVVMYMLSGEPPFVSKTKANLLEKITNQEVTFTQPIWATVSDAAKNLLTCLLKVDPAYRMSASQILENPWITGDTNGPAIPSNVLDMMHDHAQQEEGKEMMKIYLNSDNLIQVINNTYSTVCQGALMKTMDEAELKKLPRGTRPSPPQRPLRTCHRSPGQLQQRPTVSAGTLRTTASAHAPHPRRYHSTP